MSEEQNPPVPPVPPAPTPAPQGTPTPAPAPKPAAVSPAVQPVMTRRKFISWFALGWIAFSAAMAGFLTTIVRYLFPNVLFEPPMNFKAGLPSEYIVDKVDERFKVKYGVWIVRNSEGIYALSTVCTHLGCTPNWLDAEKRFKCPCHGSGFRMSGINFEGPAPRPLERYKIELADDGQIMIDKSKAFLQEKGEWSDPLSILKV